MESAEFLPLTSKNVAFSSALKLIQNRNGSVSGAHLVIFGFRHYIQSIICRYIFSIVHFYFCQYQKVYV